MLTKQVNNVIRSPAMLRQFLSLFLVLVLLLSSVVPAVSHAEEPSPRYSEEQVSGKLRSYARDSDSLPGILESGRTMIEVWILTGVELVRRQLAPGQDALEMDEAEFDLKRLEPMAFDAADKMVNNGENWASILGSQALNAITSHPNEVISDVLAHSATRSLLVDLVHSGILSFISYVGFSTGGELWMEARRMLKSEEDYQRSERILDLCLSAYFPKRGQTPQGIVLTRDDRRILNEIFENLFKILITDDALRGDLIYNTWRLRLGTGDAAVSVAIAVATSQVGPFLFPATESFLPFLALGIAGGIASQFIPQKYKNEVTNWIRRGREEFHSIEMQAQKNGFLALVRKEAGKSMNDARRGQVFESMLTNRASKRTRLVNVYFEEYYKNYSRFETVAGELLASEQLLGSRGRFPRETGGLLYPADQVILEGLNERRATLLALDQELEKITQKIASLYQAEDELLAEAIELPEARSLQQAKDRASQSLGEIRRSRGRIQHFLGTLARFRQKIIHAPTGQVKSSLSERRARRDLIQAYYRGFHEPANPAR